MTPQIETEYCRRCRRETRWNLTGNQNGSRPVALFWRCATCRIERVALANVPDVEALALSIVRDRRRPAVGELSRDEARLDYPDAIGQVTEAIYAAYVDWKADRNPSFLSWATFKGRCALTDWYRDTLGRDTPKMLSWALSLDAIAEDEESDDGGESRSSTVGAIAALAEGSLTHALVQIEDEETIETLRLVVLPIALGYSQAEVAELHGQSEGWVSTRLRRLRLREDLRIPA